MLIGAKFPQPNASVVQFNEQTAVYKSILEFAPLAAMAERLEALELRNNHSIQLTAAESLGDNLWQK